MFSLSGMPLIISPVSASACLTHPHACTILYHRNAGRHPNTSSSFPFPCLCTYHSLYLDFFFSPIYFSNSSSSFKTQMKWSFLSGAFSETLRHFIKSILSLSKYLLSVYYVPSTQGRDYILLICIAHCNLNISRSQYK